MNQDTYAKVDFQTTIHGFSNNRGYGNLLISRYQDGKILHDKHMYNRIQPIQGKFGDHYPTNQQLNPQTDLAWATNQN